MGYWRRGVRYAILFSGASNNRHVNDLEFLYRTLIDIYGFNKNNIYVLNYDGSIDYSGGPHPVDKWPGDDTDYQISVNDHGTKAAFESTFDTIKNKLKINDFLLIHTNNHGGLDYSNNEVFLCTYSGDDYYASDFGDKLNELPKFTKLMVMMEQCHSGGFEDAVLDNSPAEETSFAAACEWDRNSIGGAEFDPFARDWIAAMTGVDPYDNDLDFDPDANDNGLISATEAFDYANTIKDPYDTPVYADTPQDCGDDMYLGNTDPYFILGKILDSLEIKIAYRELKELIDWPIIKDPPRPPHDFVLIDKIIHRLGRIEKLIRPKTYRKLEFDKKIDRFIHKTRRSRIIRK